MCSMACYSGVWRLWVLGGGAGGGRLQQAGQPAPSANRLGVNVLPFHIKDIAKWFLAVHGLRTPDMPAADDRRT